jgi:hypothetical protein
VIPLSTTALLERKEGFKELRLVIVLGTPFTAGIREFTITRIWFRRLVTIGALSIRSLSSQRPGIFRNFGQVGPGSIGTAATITVMPVVTASISSTSSVLVV